MRRFGKLVWTHQAWLTAAMALIMGSPRCVCQCPNGHVKPFCLGWLTHGCCCHGGCCPAPQAETAERPAAPPCPCCCGCSETQAAETDDGCQAAPAGCVRLVVQPRGVTAPQAPETAADGSAATAVLPAVIPSLRVPPRASRAASPFDLCQRLSPSDRLALL